MIRGRIGALAAPATALPRRGQRLAYEADDRAAAPLRRPRRGSSSLKVALKTILLAGGLAASVPSLPRDEIEDYLAKGERMLKAGDIAAARLFFSRAAEAGEVRGALAMARSFDQETLRTRPAAEPAGGGALVRQGEGSRPHRRAVGKPARPCRSGAPTPPGRHKPR